MLIETVGSTAEEALKNLQSQLDLAHKERDAAINMNKETMQMLEKYVCFLISKPSNFISILIFSSWLICPIKMVGLSSILKICSIVYLTVIGIYL